MRKVRGYAVYYARWLSSHSTQVRLPILLCVVLTLSLLAVRWTLSDFGRDDTRQLENFEWLSLRSRMPWTGPTPLPRLSIVIANETEDSSAAHSLWDVWVRSAREWGMLEYGMSEGSFSQLHTLTSTGCRSRENARECNLRQIDELVSATDIIWILEGNEYPTKAPDYIYRSLVRDLRPRVAIAPPSFLAHVSFYKFLRTSTSLRSTSSSNTVEALAKSASNVYQSSDDYHWTFACEKEDCYVPCGANCTTPQEKLLDRYQVDHVFRDPTLWTAKFGTGVNRVQGCPSSLATAPKIPHSDHPQLIRSTFSHLPAKAVDSLLYYQEDAVPRRSNRECSLQPFLSWRLGLNVPPTDL